MGCGTAGSETPGQCTGQTLLGGGGGTEGQRGVESVDGVMGPEEESATDSQRRERGGKKIERGACINCAGGRGEQQALPTETVIGLWEVTSRESWAERQRERDSPGVLAQSTDGETGAGAPEEAAAAEDVDFGGGFRSEFRAAALLRRDSKLSGPPWGVGTGARERATDREGATRSLSSDFYRDSGESLRLLSTTFDRSTPLGRRSRPLCPLVWGPRAPFDCDKDTECLLNLHQF